MKPITIDAQVAKMLTGIAVLIITVYTGIFGYILKLGLKWFLGKFEIIVENLNKNINNLTGELKETKDELKKTKEDFNSEKLVVRELKTKVDKHDEELKETKNNIKDVESKIQSHVNQHHKQ